ncbi:MAG: hypothetical protein KKE73_10800 [Proteobacteria bacterium]|nr:hypothetical protein [Pseudomonadota bacterium]
MDTAADARVHCRQTDQGLLLTVRIIHQGRVLWYRHNSAAPGPLQKMKAEALKQALRHHEIDRCMIQLELPL